jgi:hypothetical protein
MANIISKTFTFPIPDEFLHDDIITPSSQDWEYIGEDYINVLVERGTNKPHFGTLSDDMINDGRPIPLDHYVVRIDAMQEPLIATLLCGPGKEDNEFEKFRPEADVVVDSVDGYGEYLEPSKYHPWEIFNLDTITYDPEKRKWNIQVIHYLDIVGGIDELTWDMLREMRDNDLKASDGMESGDMPESMITELREYRQKLRDWPNVMQDLAKDPWIAYNLFPQKPSWL